MLRLFLFLLSLLLPLLPLLLPPQWFIRQLPLFSPSLPVANHPIRVSVHAHPTAPSIYQSTYPRRPWPWPCPCCEATRKSARRTPSFITSSVPAALILYRRSGVRSFE